MPQEGRRFMSRSRRAVSPIASAVPPVAPPSLPPAHALDQCVEQSEELSLVAYRHHRAVFGFADLLESASMHDDSIGPELIGKYAALLEVLAEDGKRISHACDRLNSDLLRERHPRLTGREAR